MWAAIWRRISSNTAPAIALLHRRGSAAGSGALLVAVLEEHGELGGELFGALHRLGAGGVGLDDSHVREHGLARDEDREHPQAVIDLLGPGLPVEERAHAFGEQQRQTKHRSP